ncbi:hypothetical protein LINPERPRIM_LOCUS40333 [Linum perenne]
MKVFLVNLDLAIWEMVQNDDFNPPNSYKTLTAEQILGSIEC